MKSNKNIRAFEKAIRKLALIGCFLFILSSCSKDDGPSTRDLLIGEWELDEIDNDPVIGFSFTIELEADGDYVQRLTDNLGSFTLRGEWTLTSQDIEIDLDDAEDIALELVAVSGESLLVADEDGNDLFFTKE